MKNFVRFCVFGLVALGAASCNCNSDEDVQPQHKQFVVDKIYDYNHNLLAVYEYDQHNRLVKRILNNPNTDTVNVTELMYQNDRVHEIKYTDPVFAGSNYSTLVQYNAHGQLAGIQTQQNATVFGQVNFVYSSNGKLSHMSDASGNENYFLSYTGNNITQVKAYFPGGPIGTGPLEEHTKHFTYDAHPKPSFGIDYLFVFEPLPLFGTEAPLEKNASRNNMTGVVNGTTWVYTYNADGLPATIETIWPGTTPVEPMMLRLTYKEVTSL